MHRLVVVVPRGLARCSAVVVARSYPAAGTTRRNSSSSSSTVHTPAAATTTTTTATTTDDTQPPTALVVGSSGALGSAVTRYLSRQLGMTVIGADLVEAPADLSGGWELDAFLPLPSTSATLTTLTPASNNNSDNSDDDNDDNDNTIHSQRSAATLTELSLALYQGVARVLEDTASPGLSVIVCAAGGWQGDPAATALHQQHDTDDASQDVQAAAAVLQSMMDVNLLPALATALTVQHCRTPTGPTLVVFMGATAALNATPGMLGYGVSKAATHHVVSTLAAALPATAKNRSGGGASTTTVVGILPTTLDTPGNRVANPGADTSTWTPPSALSRKIGDWWKRPSLRPHSGALVKVHQSRAGESIFELVR